MFRRRREVPSYTENISQERIIEPGEFTKEDLKRCLGATAIKLGFSRDYGDGFQALLGKRKTGNEFLVVKFLPVVRNNPTNRVLPKELPSVIAESGLWQKNAGILLPRPRGSRLVVERVEQIAELRRGRMKGVRFAGTTGHRQATLDAWGNTEVVYVDQPRPSVKKIPDVLEEIEELKTGDPDQLG